MANLIETYKFWLPKDKDIDILFLHYGKEIKDFLDYTVSFPNVKKIFTAKGDKNVDISSYDNIEKYSEKKINLPLYIYINFSDEEGNPSDFIGGKNIETYFNMPFWRRNCEGLLLFNYSGDFIDHNFWFSEPTETTNILICKRSKWAELCQILKEPSEGITQLSEQWVIEYKNYIRTILSFLVEEEYISRFVEEDNMITWIRAMIHKSISMFYNYESIEHMGDKYANTAFEKYMKKRNSNFTAQELTEYSNQYMSKEYQSKFSDDLLLTSWGFYDNSVEKNNKLKTDLLEAFTGALVISGDGISDNVGSLVVGNLYMILGDSLPFYKSMIFGLPITQVTQMNQMMKFSGSGDEPSAFTITVIDEIVKSKNASHTEYISTFKFNDKFIKMLNSKKIDINYMQEYARNYSHVQRYNENIKENKEDAKNIIYGDILNLYNKVSINREFASSFAKGVFAGLDNFEEHDLISRLKASFKDNEDDFKRINFNLDKNSGIIIMYIDVYPLKSSYSGINSLSFPGRANIPSKNLSVVKFPTSVPPGSNLKIADYGKILAIKKYLNIIE